MVVHSSLLHRMDAVSSWEIYSFSIPLTLGGDRKGFVIRLGKKWAEVAPFPGRSSESLEEAMGQLLAFFQEGKKEHLVPSVQFGIENLFRTPLYPLKASTYAFLNAKEAQHLRHTTIKIKIGSLTIEEAQTLISALSKQFRLRVDCNSAFSFQEALTLFEPFDPTLFDYIEDPTYELQHLPEFTHPFALDETLVQYETPPKNFYGYILKPTILGGKKGCLPFVEYAKMHKLKVILSPAFETGLGLLQILKLGQELDLLNEQIGLDTHRFLTYDILSEQLHFNTPEVTIIREAKVDLNRLKKIAEGTNGTLSSFSTSK